MTCRHHEVWQHAVEGTCGCHVPGRLRGQSGRKPDDQGTQSELAACHTAPAGCGDPCSSHICGVSHRQQATQSPSRQSPLTCRLGLKHPRNQHCTVTCVAATQQQNLTCLPAQILTLLGLGRLAQQIGTCPLGPAAAMGGPPQAIPSGSLRVQQGQCHPLGPAAASGAAAALS